VEAREERTLRVELALQQVRFAETVEVLGTAPREGLATSEISESVGHEMSEVLTRMAGMAKLRRGGVAQDVVMRGYQGKNLNVLVDGVKVYGACPNNMDPPAFHTDASEVERVEVGKGPFDVRNGGSLGGVVNIVTRRPHDGFSLQPTLTFDSQGLVQPTVTVGNGSERLWWQAGFSHRQGTPYRDGNGNRFTEGAGYRASAVDSDAFRIGAGWARFGAAPVSGHDIEVYAAHQEADHVLYPYLQMDGITDTTDRLNLTYKTRPKGRLLQAVRVHGYYTRVDHFMTDELRTSGEGKPRPYSMASQAGTQSVGARVEADLGVVTVGVEAVRRKWEVTTRMAGMSYMPQYSIPDVQVDSAGAYADLRRQLSRTLLLAAGTRVDRVSSRADEAIAPTPLYWAYHSTRLTSATDTLPSGNLRLVWTPTASVEFSMGVGHAERVPDPQERYFGLKRSGSDWVGDPELRPVRNTGTSLVGRWQGRDVILTGSLFYDKVADYITVYDQVRVNQTTGVMSTKARSYANVDAVVWGGEASASLVLSDRLMLSGDISVVRGRKTPRPEKGILSEDLGEIPPTSGRLALRYERGPLFGEVEGVFAARQDHVDRELGESSTPGWAVANLRSGRRFGQFKVTVAVYNIFDRQYTEHLSHLRDPFRSGTRVAEPGRTGALQVAYTF
jgi:iron complex outermembrane receptor protein